MLKPKILVVEDNNQWQAILRNTLESVAGEVSTVTNYTDAMHILTKTSFDLVLVDLRLTDYDSRDISGMAIVARLSELKIPTIIMTGYGNENTVRTAFRDYNVIDYFQKANFDLTEFRKTIDEVLKRAEDATDKKTKNQKIETKQSTRKSIKKTKGS